MLKDSYDIKSGQIKSKRLEVPLKFQIKPIKLEEFEIFNKYMTKIGFVMRQLINETNDAIIEVNAIPNILWIKFKALDQKEIYTDISNIIVTQLKVI